MLHPISGASMNDYNYTGFESQIPRHFLKNNHIAFEQPSALLLNSDVSGHFISTGGHQVHVLRVA